MLFGNTQDKPYLYLVLRKGGMPVEMNLEDKFYQANRMGEHCFRQSTEKVIMRLTLLWTCAQHYSKLFTHIIKFDSQTQLNTEF